MDNITFKSDLAQRHKSLLFFWENLLVKKEMSSFGWKWTGVEIEKDVQEYWTTESHDETVTYDVYDKFTNKYIDSFNTTEHVTKSVKKENVSITRRYNFVRVTPYCQDEKFKKYEKLHKFLYYLRKLFLYAFVGLLLINILYFLNNARDDIFSGAVVAFLWIYLFLFAGSLILSSFANKIILKCDCKNKIFKELKRRLDNVESAHKNDQIGYDTYISKVKTIENLISCL